MSYLQNRKIFPKEVTSYDVLKTVAVLLMVVDHIGFYFFSHEEWFRVFGRMCVPMWFFLIGYAKSRDIRSPILWGGGIVLLISNATVGMSIFPLNILFTIILVRLLLDFFIAKLLNDWFDLVMSCVVLVILSFPLMYVVEYGILVIPFAFVGYLARNKNLLDIAQWKIIIVLFAASIFFSLAQILLSFNFSLLQFSVMFTGLYCVTVYLYINFKPHTFNFNNVIISFLGRYTLEIYVLHLVLFKLISISLEIDKNLEWFNVKLFPFVI